MEAEAKQKRSGAFLVVEDNRFLARAIARFFADYGEVVVEHDLTGARRALRRLEMPEVQALILDVQLPDGSGLDLLAEVRRVGHQTPALVLSAFGDDDILRRAQLLHALFLPKPAPEAHLRAFIQWADRQEPARKLVVAVSQISQLRAFTPRETEVVMCAARGVDRAQIHSHLGVAPATIKTLIRRLLKKSGHGTLADLVAELHREVFTG